MARIRHSFPLCPFLHTQNINYIFWNMEVIIISEPVHKHFVGSVHKLTCSVLPIAAATFELSLPSLQRSFEARPRIDDRWHRHELGLEIVAHIQRAPIHFVLCFHRNGQSQNTLRRTNGLLKKSLNPFRRTFEMPPEVNIMKRRSRRRTVASFVRFCPLAIRTNWAAANTTKAATVCRRTFMLSLAGRNEIICSIFSLC